MLHCGLQGASSGLTEVALQNKAGTYLTAAKMNVSASTAAVIAVMPAALDGSFDAVNVLDIPDAQVCQ